MKIEDFLSGKGKKKKNQQLSQPMLIFFGFQGDDIDVVLSSFKRGLVPMIPLKAMVTATNVHWTFVQLYNELEKEHREMTK